jgi:enoyl-CoA hydratase
VRDRGRTELRALQSMSVDTVDSVATVTLRGPGKGNAMGVTFWRELPEVFARLDWDDDVRAVVLVGGGTCFSVGLDLHEILPTWAPVLDEGAQAATRSWFMAEIRRFQAAITAVAMCRKPVVAAVSSWCLGGGLDLAAAADVRVAANDAVFGIRETRLAIVADVGSLQRLRGVIGEGHLRELALTGRDIGAADAMRIGLVNRVLEDREGALQHAREIAREMAANPPLAVQGTKQVLNEAREHQVAAELRQAAVWNAAFLPSADLHEALAAFAQRRPARFHGR